MTTPNHKTTPHIEKSVGTVVGGFAIGSGEPKLSRVLLDSTIKNASQAIAKLTGGDVTIRYNSSGFSGGAFLVTDKISNSDIGISCTLLSMNILLERNQKLPEYKNDLDGAKKYCRQLILRDLGRDITDDEECVAIHTYISKDYLKDIAIANSGTRSSPSAWHMHTSIEDAIQFLKSNAKPGYVKPSNVSLSRKPKQNTF